MFKNWSIGLKLITAFLTVAGIATLIAVVGYSGLSQMMKATDEIAENRMISIEQLGIMDEAQTAVKSAGRSSLIKELPDEDVASQVKHRDDAWKNYRAAWAAYEPLETTEEEDRLLADLTPKWDAYVAAEKTTWDATQEWRKSRKADAHGEDVKTEALYDKALALSVGAGSETAKAAEAVLMELTTLNSAEGARLSKAADDTYSSVLIMLVSAAVVGVVLAIALGILVTRSITKPLERVIAGMTAGAEQVSSAAGQVAQASQQMAQGASEQASSLEETSSSLEEMSSMTRQNAENSKQADGMAREAGSSASKGVESMERMSDAIARIKESADSTAKIIKTIDEIAFQTNLLALNAAVEAARAGEAGKGFAVVAEEVRNLAQRSAEAAKTTANLIEGSQSNADGGVKVAGEVGELLKQIAEQAGKVTSLVSEVAAASAEQAQGIDQVNTAVNEMDKVTQSSASNSEESASASEELSAQARELQDMVVQLRVVVGGAKVALRADDFGYGAALSAAARQGASVDHRLSQSVHSVLGRQGGDVAEGGNGGHGAKRPAAVGAARPSPEEVIPLGDDELKDF